MAFLHAINIRQYNIIIIVWSGFLSACMQTLSVITALMCRVSNRLAFRPCRTGRILPSLSIKIISLYKEKDQARISFADRTHVQTVSFLSRCQTSMWFPRYKDPAYDRFVVLEHSTYTTPSY